MSDWAERAYQKFQDQANDERRQEELELQRHSKTVAGAEQFWKDLIKRITRNVERLNAKMGREFLEVLDLST